MPSYHYIALAQSGSELSGVIEAADETAARAHLNQLNLSVVSLEVAAAPGPQAVAPAAGASGKTVFEFEAIDHKGKKVVGTISAETAVKAFARLFEEYQLNVVYLAPASATSQEKTAARTEGIVRFQKEYEKLFEKERAEEAKIADQQALEEKVKKELLDKIEFTSKMMETFLQNFGADMKQEERDTIQTYLNQIVRIKSSTNLEHIRFTCERMLEHVQKQTLFMNEELHRKENSKLKIETKTLLDDLKKTGLQQDIDIIKTASRWRESPFLRPFGNLLLRLLNAENPAILKLRDEIKTVNHYLWAYAKLFFFGKPKDVRSDAWESIKNLREEKKRLKLQMKALKLEAKRARQAASEASLFWENTGAVLGWVLAFYLAVYIVAYPLTTKQFGFPNIPRSLYFYQPQLTTGITIFFFFAYAAVTIRNLWLRKHKGAVLILYPLAAFSFLLFAINLL